MLSPFPQNASKYLSRFGWRAPFNIMLLRCVRCAHCSFQDQTHVVSLHSFIYKNKLKTGIGKTTHESSWRNSSFKTCFCSDACFYWKKLDLVMVCSCQLSSLFPFPPSLGLHSIFSVESDCIWLNAILGWPFFRDLLPLIHWGYFLGTNSNRLEQKCSIQ